MHNFEFKESIVNSQQKKLISRAVLASVTSTHELNNML